LKRNIEAQRVNDPLGGGIGLSPAKVK